MSRATFESVESGVGPLTFFTFGGRAGGRELGSLLLLRANFGFSLMLCAVGHDAPTSQSRRIRRVVMRLSSDFGSPPGRGAPHTFVMSVCIFLGLFRRVGLCRGASCRSVGCPPGCVWGGCFFNHLQFKFGTNSGNSQFSFVVSCFSCLLAFQTLFLLLTRHTLKGLNHLQCIIQH